MAVATGRMKPGVEAFRIRVTRPAASDAAHDRRVAGTWPRPAWISEIRPEFYLPNAQVTYNSFSIPSYWIIRTAGDP